MSETRFPTSVWTYTSNYPLYIPQKKSTIQICLITAIFVDVFTPAINNMNLKWTWFNVMMSYNKL